MASTTPLRLCARPQFPLVGLSVARCWVSSPIGSATEAGNHRRRGPESAQTVGAAVSDLSTSLRSSRGEVATTSLPSTAGSSRRTTSSTASSRHGRTTRGSRAAHCSTTSTRTHGARREDHSCHDQGRERGNARSLFRRQPLDAGQEVVDKFPKMNTGDGAVGTGPFVVKAYEEMVSAAVRAQPGLLETRRSLHRDHPDEVLQRLPRRLGGLPGWSGRHLPHSRPGSQELHRLAGTRLHA